MEAQAAKLKTLIEPAGRILITSHISPDPDAVASVLLTGLSLAKNYPDRQIKMILEEKPENLSFMDGFEKIDFLPIYEALTEFKPDLFILLDANNFERCAKHDGQKIRDFVISKKLATVIIDHHEPAGKDESAIFINNTSASTVQDVYEILFDKLSLPKPSSVAQTAMTGLYADTGGFVYVKPGRQNEIFGFASQLVSDGADLETVKYQLESYTEPDMKVLAQLALNVTHSGNYTYSFLTDEFIDQTGLTSLQMQRPTNTFLNGYIRNIDGRRWGFIAYKNLLQGEGYYSASFRSQAGVPDVSLIAGRLGGGGHKPAAGAKFEASSLQEALNRIKTVIAAAI